MIDPNDYPFKNVANAAFADLLNWVNHGTPPPHANPIDGQWRDNRARRIRQCAGWRADPVRRRADHDVLSHRHGGPSHAVLGVLHPVRLQHAVQPGHLQSLYPNHGEYVAKVTRASMHLVHQGFWLMPDAHDVHQQGVHSAVP